MARLATSQTVVECRRSGAERLRAVDLLVLLLRISGTNWRRIVATSKRDVGLKKIVREVRRLHPNRDWQTRLARPCSKHEQ